MAVDLDPSGAAAQYMPPIETTTDSCASACTDLAEAVDDLAEAVDNMRSNTVLDIATGIAIGIALTMAIFWWFDYGPPQANPTAPQAPSEWTFETIPTPPPPPRVQSKITGSEAFAPAPNGMLEFPLFDSQGEIERRELDEMIDDLEEMNKLFEPKPLRGKHREFLIPKGVPLRNKPVKGLEA